MPPTDIHPSGHSSIRPSIRPSLSRIGAISFFYSIFLNRSVLITLGRMLRLERESVGEAIIISFFFSLTLTFHFQLLVCSPSIFTDFHSIGRYVCIFISCSERGKKEKKLVYGGFGVIYVDGMMNPIILFILTLSLHYSPLIFSS